MPQVESSHGSSHGLRNEPSTSSVWNPLTPTGVFEAYWQFATERQNVYFRRLLQAPQPWTSDQVLRRYKFTNAYRAADRVSQYLLSRIIYDEKNFPSYGPEDVIFRVLLFKLFNKIETWELLESEFEEISLANFQEEKWSEILDAARSRQSIYTAAYIVPPVQQSDHRVKHRGHLELLASMLRTLPKKLAKARSLASIYEALIVSPGIGSFLAYQFAVDLNYTELFRFSEDDFVVAGPGARRGIDRCFTSRGGLSPEDIIRLVTQRQEVEFRSRRLHFRDLFGRPLQLIDCQNLFCEIDKYARVAFPMVSTQSRTRIKQKFRTTGDLPRPFFPPHWGINANVRATFPFG